MARKKRASKPKPTVEKPDTVVKTSQFATHEEIVDILEGVLRWYVEHERRKRANAQEVGSENSLQSKDADYG